MAGPTPDETPAPGQENWFRAHQQLILIVGAIAALATVAIWWQGRRGSSGSGQLASGGQPSATVTDSTTAQALDSITQAIQNLLDQLSKNQVGGGGGGGGGGGDGGGGGGQSFLDWLASLGPAAQQAYASATTAQQQYAQTLYTSQGPQAVLTWWQSGGTVPSPIVPPRTIKPPPTPTIPPTLPQTQQTNWHPHQIGNAPQTVTSVAGRG